MSCDFVFLGPCSIVTVSPIHHLRTSSSNPHASDMGNSGLSGLLPVSHSEMPMVPPFVLPYTEVSRWPDTCFSPQSMSLHVLPDLEHRVFYDKARSTQCPHAGSGFDVAGMTLPQQQGPMGMRGEWAPGPFPLPCCAFLSPIWTIPDTRDLRGSDPSDVLR